MHFIKKKKHWSHFFWHATIILGKTCMNSFSGFDCFLFLLSYIWKTNLSHKLWVKFSGNNILPLYWMAQSIIRETRIFLRIRSTHLNYFQSVSWMKYKRAIVNIAQKFTALTRVFRNNHILVLVLLSVNRTLRVLLLLLLLLLHQVFYLIPESDLLACDIWIC